MCTSRFTVSSCVARHCGLKIPDHAPRTSYESHTIHISNAWPIPGARPRAASVGIEPIGASLCLSARCGYVPLPRANSCAPDGLRGDDGGVGSLRVPLPRHVRRRMSGGRVQQLAYFSTQTPISPICRTPLFPISRDLILFFSPLRVPTPTRTPLCVRAFRRSPRQPARSTRCSWRTNGS